MDRDGLLIITREGQLATVILNRPAKRNALSIALRFALADALEELAADDDVNAVLLTGAGTAFCAGVDVSQFGGDRSNREALVECSARCFGTLARFEKPVVAYLNGPAFGGGFVLALLCDLRWAGSTARVGFPELTRGIPPSYAAARAALPDAQARELCLTGEILDAVAAHERGIVNGIAGPDAGRAVAEKIAAAAPQATRVTKRRALLDASRTWLPLLDEELKELRAALLSG